MKAIEQYFHVVLFIMLSKLVLTSKSVDETLECDHSNESYLFFNFICLDETLVYNGHDQANESFVQFFYVALFITLYK